jgi:RHS repeat-associated protein
VNKFSYGYDPATNRVTEQIDPTTRQFSYNALNQLTSIEGQVSPDATYRWDAENRLIAVISGNQTTEFTYDGLGRRVRIRLLVNGVEVSSRRFVWCGNDVCEERTPLGIVTKRFFLQGMKVESGPTVGNYFYSHDHLGSIRELTDSSGIVRSQYSYDLFGRRILLSQNVEGDFGFARMFWLADSGLNLTRFRAYDPRVGRWLSRDPTSSAEVNEDPNLYAYVRNDPVNLIDPSGLACCEYQWAAYLVALGNEALNSADALLVKRGRDFISTGKCVLSYLAAKLAQKILNECLKNCPPDPEPPPPDWCLDYENSPIPCNPDRTCSETLPPASFPPPDVDPPDE